VPEIEQPALLPVKLPLEVMFTVASVPSSPVRDHVPVICPSTAGVLYVKPLVAGADPENDMAAPFELIVPLTDAVVIVPVVLPETAGLNPKSLTDVEEKLVPLRLVGPCTKPFTTNVEPLMLPYSAQTSAFSSASISNCVLVGLPVMVPVYSPSASAAAGVAGPEGVEGVLARCGSDSQAIPS